MEPFVEVNISLQLEYRWNLMRHLLDNDVGVSSANTFDFCQGEHDFVLPVDVGVKKTEDVLECILVRDNESHVQRRMRWW